MTRSSSLIAGLSLIGLGVVALFFTLTGMDVWLAWRWWPSAIIGVGALLAIAPVLARNRWMGLLYIIATPIVATGIMLLIALTISNWFFWARWWPIEVLAVAAGFAVAALYARQAWLSVPAFVIGANGGLFLFCALTGQWQLWKVLWIVQPLSLGAALLFVGVRKHSAATFGFGAALSVLTMFFSAMMTPIFRDTAQLTGSLGALTLVVLGGALLLWNVRRTPKLADVASSNNPGIVAQ